MLYKLLLVLAFLLYVSGAQMATTDSIDGTEDASIDGTEVASIDGTDSGDSADATESVSVDDASIDSTGSGDSDDSDDSDDSIDSTGSGESGDSGDSDDDDDSSNASDMSGDSDDDSDDDDDDTSADSDDDSNSNSDDETNTVADDNFCNGLTASQCTDEVSSDGDGYCAFNEVTQECYNIVRRAGTRGSGGFDDGYRAANKAAQEESSHLEAIIGVLGAIIGILAIAMSAGGYYMYQHSRKPDAGIHDAVNEMVESPQTVRVDDGESKFVSNHNEDAQSPMVLRA